MSGRNARRDRREQRQAEAAARGHLLVPAAMIPPPANEPPPSPRAPETIRTVIDAVGTLESMGDASFEKLLAGYRDVEAAKGATFAFAWMSYELLYHVGPGATRAIAAAGVLAVHRVREADAKAAAEKAVRVEWLRWAVGQMTARMLAALDQPPAAPGFAQRSTRRYQAMKRLVDALAREAS